MEGCLEKVDRFQNGRVDPGSREIDGAKERTEMLLEAPGHGVNVLPFKGDFIDARLVDQRIGKAC